MQHAVLPAASAAAPLAAARRSTCLSRTILLPFQPNQRTCRRLVAARAEKADSSAAASTSAAPPPAAAAAPGEELLAAEQLLSKGRRKPKAGKTGPTVIAPLRDQVYGGGPLTPEQKAENSVVALLATLFFVILAEGVFLAGSGFMPDALDQFAQDVVFPAFSPTLGVFLAISTAYGLWKTRSSDGEQK